MKPDYTLVLRRNLTGALKGRKLTEAAALLERLREEDPLSVETRGLELEYLVRCGRTDDAHRLAQQLVELFPASAHIRHWSGRAAYALKLYEDAQQHFSESNRVARRWKNNRWLGKTLTQLGRFDQAEALLVPLVSDYPKCRRDLAWLYERKGELDRAMSQVEGYLEVRPDDEMARDHRLRLRARLMDVGELRREVEELCEFGEDIDDAILPEYVEGLLRTGEGNTAREIVRQRLDALESQIVTRIGWIAYHLQAFDLALDLFLRILPLNLGNIKFKVSVEKTARSCLRTTELVAAYRQHAPQHRDLYGRIKTLERFARDRERQSSKAETR